MWYWLRLFFLLCILLSLSWLLDKMLLWFVCAFLWILIFESNQKNSTCTLHTNHAQMFLVHHMPAMLYSYKLFSRINIIQYQCCVICSFTLPFHSRRMMQNYYISVLNKLSKVTDIPLMRRKPKLNKKINIYLCKFSIRILPDYSVGAWIWVPL